MTPKFTKSQVADFIILTLRWYLAVYMVDYGWGKMTGGQFGVASPEILETPLKDVDPFHIAWYLFGLNKWFDIIVGLSQIIGAILIVFNRTTIIGALFLLPILGQIFLVDVAFTTSIFGPALPIRLATMIACALAILMYHRDRMVTAWNVLTKDLTTKNNYKWWLFLLLPIIGYLMDLVLAVLTWPIKILTIWIMK